MNDGDECMLKDRAHKILAILLVLVFSVFSELFLIIFNNCHVGYRRSLEGRGRQTLFSSLYIKCMKIYE